MEKKLNSWETREARRLNKARHLLQPAVEGSDGLWADVGCGDGIFTYLLGQLLQFQRQIYAVDKDPRALQTLERNLEAWGLDCPIHLHRADFIVSYQ